MATSTGKTVALILLIAIILLVGVRLTPLFMAPFGLIQSISHAFRLPSVDNFYIGPHTFRISLISIVSLLMLVIWAFIIIWVYRDAEQRGMNGLLWALLVLIGNLIGLLIYLILRSDTEPKAKAPLELQTCQKCLKVVDAGFQFCPHCGAKMDKSVCPKCEKKVEEDWKACPHCGTRLK